MISFKIIIQSKTATFSKSFRGVSNIIPVKFLKPDRGNQKTAANDHPRPKSSKPHPFRSHFGE